MLNNIAERIFNLEAFDLYQAFDVYGTIDEAKQGIAETIEVAPDDLISWLSDVINDIDSNDDADEVMEIIAAVKEYAEKRNRKEPEKMNDFRELYDLDPHFNILDDDGHIMVNGQVYTYEMTLSSEIDDEHCCRVMIDGEYYYFG
jgi:hypothetical protein